MKKRLNSENKNISYQDNKKDNKQVVYGWCVMASTQNEKNNKIVIYTDSKKPKRGNTGWEGFDGVIYFGETNDISLIKDRTCKSEPLLVKLIVEKV